MALLLTAIVCFYALLSVQGPVSGVAVRTTEKPDPEDQAEEDGKARISVIFKKYCDDATKGDLLAKTQECFKQIYKDNDTMVCNEEAYGTFKRPEERKAVDCNSKKRRKKLVSVRKCLKAFEKGHKLTEEQEEVEDKVWDAMSEEEKQKKNEAEDKAKEAEEVKALEKMERAMDCGEKLYGIIRTTTPPPTTN